MMPNFRLANFDEMSRGISNVDWIKVLGVDTKDKMWSYLKSTTHLPEREDKKKSNEK